MTSKRLLSHFNKGTFFVLLFVTMSVLVQAQYQDEGIAGFPRVWGINFSGGFAQTADFGSVPEFTGELQFRIAPRVYAAVAVGYLGDTIHRHSSRTLSGAPMGFVDHLHRFQVVPIMLNVYYAVPLSAKLAAYATAGGGYFAATYWDLNTQSQGDFGGHVGVGLNFRPSPRMELFTAGTYRVARIDGFQEEILPVSVPGGVPASTFNLNLDGLRLQFGMRFRF